MPLPTSLPAARCELRAKVLAQIARGESLSRTAKQYNLSPGTVHHWVRNPHLAEPNGDRRFSIDWSELRAMAENQPDLPISDLAQHFGVTYNAVWRALRIMGLSRRSGKK